MVNSGTTTGEGTIPSPAAAAAEIQARVVGLKIPVRDHPNGPVTRARLRRTFSVIACGWALGLVLLLASGRVALEAFGLGLLLPGGGFAYTADPALAAALFAFGLALVIYWAFGPVLLPPAVWIGTAALSVLRVDEEQLAPPKHVAHPPQRDQQRREDQRVDRVRPLGRHRSDIEVANDRRNRDVHNRRVDDDHRNAEGDERHRIPAAAVRGDGGRLWHRRGDANHCSHHAILRA